MQAAGGNHIACVGCILVLPGTMQPHRFYQLSGSPLPYKECNFSCTSLPPDLTADRAQPHIYHQLPALTFNIMELDASPFLEMRSPLPHPVCLPCVGLPLTLLTVIFQTLCLHMVLSAAGRPALHQWSSSSCRSQGAGWIVSAAHTVLPGE